MSYTVWIENARRRDLAVLSARPSAETLPEAIDTRVTRLYELLRTASVVTIGRNVAVYRTAAGSPNAQRWVPAAPIEVGVEVVLPPRGVDGIDASTTPEGLVATTEHVGPLESLPDAHAAVRAWCRSNGWEISGTSWDVYGRWSGDPNRWQTAVYYLVR
jgi:hypothetical protein